MDWLRGIPHFLTAIDNFINLTYFNVIDLICSGDDASNTYEVGGFTSLDQFNAQGFQPLHYAISLKCPTAVDWILSLPGVQVNAFTECNAGRWNSAHLAVRTKQSGILAKLIKDHNVNLNAHDNEGLTPLAHITNEDEVGLDSWIHLINPENQRVDFNVHLTKIQRNYFHFFATDQTLSLLIFLCFHNHDGIDHLDQTRTSPLMLAAETGQTQAVKMLLENGANFSILDQFGRSALFRAASSGQADTCKALLLSDDETFHPEEDESKARNLLEIQEPSTGYTPLHIAVVHKHLSVVKTIVASSPSFSSGYLQIQDTLDGNTALHLAVQLKNLDIIKALLDAGASTDSKNNLNRAPLDMIDPSDPDFEDISNMLSFEFVSS